MPNKKQSRSAKAAKFLSKMQNYSNDGVSQCQRVISWFKHVSSHLTTMQARDGLGIMSPAARVLELRQDGHLILTERTYEYDANGVEHRMGVYIYRGKRSANDAKN